MQFEILRYRGVDYMIEKNNNEFKKSYRRILQQEQFVQAVVKVANEQLPDMNLGEILDEKYGKIEDCSIAITHNGDVKWWEKTLGKVENRFAYSVKRVVGEDEGLLDHLKEELYKLGQEINVEYENRPVIYMYYVIRNLLLDGGVTEEFNKIMSESFDEVVWTRNRPTTQKYWTYLDVDFNKYYIPLRRSFIYGLLEKTDIKFSTLDDTIFVLARR